MCQSSVSGYLETGQAEVDPPRHLVPRGSNPNNHPQVIPASKSMTRNLERVHGTVLKMVPRQPESVEVPFTQQNPLSAIHLLAGELFSPHTPRSAALPGGFQEAKRQHSPLVSRG